MSARATEHTVFNRACRAQAINAEADEDAQDVETPKHGLDHAQHEREQKRGEFEAGVDGFHVHPQGKRGGFGGAALRLGFSCPATSESITRGGVLAGIASLAFMASMVAACLA